MSNPTSLVLLLSWYPYKSCQIIIKLIRTISKAIVVIFITVLAIIYKT